MWKLARLWFAVLSICLGREALAEQLDSLPMSFRIRNFVTLRLETEMSFAEDLHVRIFTFYDYYFAQRTCRSEDCPAQRFLVIVYRDGESPFLTSFQSEVSTSWTTFKIFDLGNDLKGRRKLQIRACSAKLGPKCTKSLSKDIQFSE